MTGEMASPPAVLISGLTKSFTGRDGRPLEVLRGIDLEVARGEVHALLGPSGCGKTTLLNILAGLTGYDSGWIAVDGVEFGAFNDWQHIGYVFQDDRLLPWRTTLDNVALALEASVPGRRARRALASEMLALMDLSAFAGAYPHELSGGMRSRVALARSLITRPGLMVMDEPFSGLDTFTRETLYRDLLHLRRRLGSTILMVTHDVEEAVTLADAVTVLTQRPCQVLTRMALPGRTPRDGTEPEIVTVIQRIKKALRTGHTPAPCPGDQPGQDVDLT